MRTLITALLFCVGVAQSASIPPAGKELPADQKAELQKGLVELQKEIDALRGDALIADVMIYHKAVDWPLRFGELIDFKKAQTALAAGRQRAADLKAGKSPWVKTGGVRAYISKIDGSVQPFVLVTPKETPAGQKHRLDFFFHGRSETLTELNFITGKHNEAPANPGTHYTVYPYGRYCNANKFAGETDTMELMDFMKRHYAIDENRIVITGFSMGGAACWHHAVHHADLFVAASPGAGFCETRIYQKMDALGEWDAQPAWRRKLFHLYDCPDYAVNLSMLPTIAYAGELDPQRQSGEIMLKATTAAGFPIERIIGPNTAHKYEPAAKKELDQRLEALALKGRDQTPENLRFTTHTLRYNKMRWVTVDGLGQHWERATVDGKLEPAGAITLATANITALTIDIPAGKTFAASKEVAINIDKSIVKSKAGSDGALRISLRKSGAAWAVAGPVDGLAKQHGLQGPIDDAFMDSFLIVKPTGTAFNEKSGKWVAHELKYAADEWRKIFRGEARLKNDTEVNDADIAAHNLVLFGDPASNAILKKIAAKLPVGWDAQQIKLGDKTFSSEDHAVILIHPNPLNPKKYIVINSGFTFRQADHKTNSRQVAKLPDFAVIDLNTPPDDGKPGEIKAAGFFDERWKLPGQ